MNIVPGRHETHQIDFILKYSVQSVNLCGDGVAYGGRDGGLMQRSGYNEGEISIIAKDPTVIFFSAAY